MSEILLNNEFSNIKSCIVEKAIAEKIVRKYAFKQELGIKEDLVDIAKLYDKEFNELVKDGILKKLDKKKFAINLPKHYVIGNIYFNNQGNGFLTDENTKDIYFIYKNNSLNALYGDKVIISVTKEKKDNKKAEGEVISVLERNIKKVIGTYMEYDNNVKFVIPDSKLNSDIYIPVNNMDAKSYEKVVVNIIKYPTYKLTSEGIQVYSPEGEIVEVLGMKGDKGVDSLSIIKANDIREEFPADVLKEASEIPTTISDYDLDYRLDLRNEIIFTIDGADSKDLDDAISIKKIEEGYELGVHIADVSHYVKENGAIDKEAILRGTSVYLVDKVIPMLPKILSNNVCSLNPFEDKLTLSCIMKIDENGRVIKSKIQESVISSKARLIYDDVTKFLEDNNQEFINKFSSEVAESLIIGKELASILRKKRDTRGSIEFETLETKFELDENGKVISIKPYERGISNDMIEEFMLIANETVAKKFADLKIPFIYRTHDYPRMEKLELFDKIAKNYGFDINLAVEDIEPKTIQTFLEENKDREEIVPLTEILLHSMQQARYSNVCSMHFGLASNYYCHFTSPIRRYPDLQIHRIIKKSLHGEINNVTKAKYEKITEEIAEHCSKAERKADEAERELDRCKIYEYLLDNNTTIYEGRIKNFNKKGFYVTLDNSAEGFIKPFNYEFDEDLYQATILGKTYKLGDKINVKLKNSNNLLTKEIQFLIVDKEVE